MMPHDTPPSTTMSQTAATTAYRTTNHLTASQLYQHFDHVDQRYLDLPIYREPDQEYMVASDKPEQVYSGQSFYPITTTASTLLPTDYWPVPTSHSPVTWPLASQPIAAAPSASPQIGGESFLSGASSLFPMAGPSTLPQPPRSASMVSTSNVSSTLSSDSQSDNVSSGEGARRKHAETTTEHGYLNDEGNWCCSFPGCTSRATFARGCDLRKHYKRHTKSYFCRYENCPQSHEGGFSSKKDRARHEAKHNPGVRCEWWPQCTRVFSRQDNMKDHVRRIHKRGLK